MISTKLEGDAILRNKLIKMVAAIPEGIAVAIKECAERIRDDAKIYCPVDTGSLRQSIRISVYNKPSGKTHKIGISAGGYIVNPKSRRMVDYASYVEYGTSRQRSQPYMRTAILTNQSFVEEVYRKKIREWLETRGE